MGMTDYMTRILELISCGDIDNADEMILFMADDRDITPDEVATILAAVEKDDPTYSGDAAQIRDTLRDNVDFPIL